MSKSSAPDSSRRNFLGMSAGAVGLLATGAATGTAFAAAAPSSSATAQTAAAQAASVPTPVCLPGIPVAKDYQALREERLAQCTPEMRKIYEEQAAAPPIRQIGIDALRASGNVPQNNIVPDGVTAYNTTIPGPDGPVPTRVWMPEGVKKPVGVYLSTHGGGWNFGNGMEYHDAEEGQHVLDWGCAVVRPDYRVAPEHKFPSAIEDCYAALKYIGRHGREMGLDTSRIGVGGGCAGANIGTVISLMARDAGETMPAVQYLWSGAFDMRNNYQSYLEFGDGYGLRADDADFVTQNYFTSREDSFDWRASPILAPTLKGAPPALVWMGQWEILHDEGMAYVGRLRDAGVPVHLVVGPQQGHGFIYLHPDTAYSKKARPKIDRIMRSYIGPEAALKR